MGRRRCASPAPLWLDMVFLPVNAPAGAPYEADPADLRLYHEGVVDHQHQKNDTDGNDEKKGEKWGDDWIRDSEIHNDTFEE